MMMINIQIYVKSPRCRTHSCYRNILGDISSQKTSVQETAYKKLHKIHPIVPLLKENTLPH